ncbi:MAG: hypothetical protein ABIY37_11765, partial [Devosia sp.]
MAKGLASASLLGLDRKNANSQVAISRLTRQNDVSMHAGGPGRVAAFCCNWVDLKVRPMRPFGCFVQAIRPWRGHGAPAFAGGTNQPDTRKNYSLGEVVPSTYVRLQPRSSPRPPVAAVDRGAPMMLKTEAERESIRRWRDLP